MSEERSLSDVLVAALVFIAAALWLAVVVFLILAIWTVGDDSGRWFATSCVTFFPAAGASLALVVAVGL